MHRTAASARRRRRRASHGHTAARRRSRNLRREGAATGWALREGARVVTAARR
ncbi:Os07g0459000 [Oryza sativa Japonica Group]|uniref:Os07g0459000 protein n=1 Tax=Oryza sativa subsp. japonica TaxID=39947 RepID=Q7EY95_ORYSJ|nr:unknown protein [Oryza sativa Japonica Group]BAF21487.1 Os07g0459000 [Oryza sativa Japonica Group]|eukprot:NP_001059573.1 Os07g0459000 [Oryza sativa Japonica Group]